MDCLDAGAWILVHCGQMRNARHGLCDIPFEVKKILSSMNGVTLQVSSDPLSHISTYLVKFGAHFFYICLSATFARTKSFVCPQPGVA